MPWIKTDRTQNMTIGAFVALCFILGACGDSSDSADTTDTSTPAPTSTSAAPASSTSAPADTTTIVTLPAFEFSHSLFDVGSCWNDEGDYSEPIPVVDCSGEHDVEVFAMEQLPDEIDAPYPGEDQIAALAFSEVCDPTYETFMSTSSSAGVIPYFALYPLEETWMQGDRTVVCQVFDEVPMVGSVSSAGLTLPDTALFYIGNNEGDVEMYFLLDGQEPQALTEDDLEEDAYPPSVDGLRVTYAVWNEDLSERDILVIDLEALSVNPVLATPADEGMPMVSPDGSQTVYISDEGADDFDIWIMNSDGSNPQRLTTNPDRDSSPMWSPDGTKLIYRARIDGESNIWTMNPDGSDPQQLTDDPASDYDPIFSPDGSKIAFTSERDGGLDIWVMDADGSNPVNISQHPAVDEYPAWSPDGSAIVFTSSRFNQTLWVMAADGSAQSLLSKAPLNGFAAMVGSAS